MKGIKARLRATLSHLFEFEDCGDSLRVTTLVSPHGDYITVFIHEIPEGGYEVSDNGEIIRQIQLLGLVVSAVRLVDICNLFGVELLTEN